MAWPYTTNKDDALRFSWLDTKKISVAKIKIGLWKVTFHMPCKMLAKKGRGFYCKQHKEKRPEYCKTYPLNMEGEIKEVIEAENKTCPIIKEIVSPL